MDNQIIIHATDKQKRIALIENGELAQFFIESPENRRSVGDIYLAQVHKVMGGIRAAFIDLSTPKDAFLHFSDLGEHLEEYLVMLNGREALPSKPLGVLHDFKKQRQDGKLKNMSPREATALEQNHLGNILKTGQKIIVQVVKEPIGSKGPRVSTDITMAGRFIVLIPFGDYVAVSKRIRSYKERRRLRGIMRDMLPDGFGVIVRTVADGQSEESLREDLKELHDRWVNITDQLKTAKPTHLLHRDLDMTESLVRDLFSKNYKRILVDDANTYKSIKNYVKKFSPQHSNSVEQFKGKEHIFDHLKVSRDIESIFSPRVKMPSGGYLIFEQTEAMYVVDVNSGRYAAKKAQEDNSLRTNLEAAREIAKQLRLRDIGGIIVVDFIDLQHDSNRKKIYDEIKKEFRKDRAKTNILPMSDFGLMQITRQRIRPSVVKSVSKVCPMCGGSGSIVSEDTLLSDLESWLTKFKYDYKQRSVEIYLNPYFHSVVCQGLISQRLKWMFKYFMRITIHPDESISLNDFKATLPGSEVDIYSAVIEGQILDEFISESEKSMADLESAGPRDDSNLEIDKREKRKNGGSRSGGGQNRNTSGKQDDNDNRNIRSDNNQGKSKYYKSGDQKNDNKQDTEDLPSAIAVAKAYARKQDAQDNSGDTSKKDDSSDKKAQSAPKPKPAKKEQDSAKESKEKDTSDSKGKAGKKVRGPVKVKKPSKAKKSEDSGDDKPKAPEKKSSEKKSDKAPAKDEKGDVIADRTALKLTPRELAAREAAKEARKEIKNETDPEKVSALEVLEAAKAKLSEDQFRKPQATQASDSATAVKRSTVKKRPQAEQAEEEKEEPKAGKEASEKPAKKTSRAKKTASNGKSDSKKESAEAKKEETVPDSSDS